MNCIEIEFILSNKKIIYAIKFLYYLIIVIVLDVQKHVLWEKRLSIVINCFFLMKLFFKS